MAVFDRFGMSPFSIAVIQGHLDVAKAIIEIVQVQYKPKEKRGETRYMMEHGTSEYNGSEGTIEGDDKLDIYSELVDDQFTIENIGEVATQVECPITPLEVLTYSCTCRLFTEQDGMSLDEKLELESKLDYISNDGMKSLCDSIDISPLNVPNGLLEYAIWKDDTSLLNFLLELGQDLTNRKAGETPTVYTVPQRAFQLGILMEHLNCLKLLISRTGTGLPIALLLEKSGIKEEKPKYYRGLTIRGKKRHEWSSNKSKTIFEDHEETPPLLAAAFYGKLGSVKWFLTNEPINHYLAFAKAHEKDTQLQRLAGSAGGVERAIKNWLGTRSKFCSIDPMSFEAVY